MQEVPHSAREQSQVLAIKQAMPSPPEEKAVAFGGVRVEEPTTTEDASGGEQSVPRSRRERVAKYFKRRAQATRKRLAVRVVMRPRTAAPKAREKRSERALGASRFSKLPGAL